MTKISRSHASSAMPPRRRMGRYAVLCLFLASAEMSLAFQPRIALTPEQLAITARRHQLPPAAKLECAALDTRIPQLTQRARRAKPPDKAPAMEALQQARLRFQLLGC